MGLLGLRDRLWGLRPPPSDMAPSAARSPDAITIRRVVAELPTTDSCLKGAARLRSTGVLLPMHPNTAAVISCARWPLLLSYGQASVIQFKHRTPARDDLEQPRWKRPRCLLGPAIASVSADRIEAPESSRAVISAWLLDWRRTDSLGSLVRGSGGPTRPVCGRWLGLRGSRHGHILRGSSARHSEYLTVRKPRPRRRVVSHERGGVCEACSVWRWWSCFWRLAGK